MYGEGFHHICWRKYRADKVEWQHGKTARLDTPPVTDMPHPIPAEKRLRHGKRQQRDSFGHRKKNGRAGGCFLLPFPVHAYSRFPAARGKAAGMLTLRGLKNMAETAPTKQKMPTVRELRLSGKLIAEKEVGECAGIAAYWNGYAVYHAGRNATVFRIHACSGYCCDSGSSPYDIGSGTFDGEAWYLRLVLEGEDRLFRNLASREQGWNVSYSAESEEWGALDSGTEGVLDRIISAETVESLLSVLSERQRRVVVLFYIEQKTERQIAEELGITASAVSRILARSLDRMHACMCKNTVPAGSGKA